ncbi:MAG: amidase [Actinomycetota bacterium]|nr:amidase [Actinomycetota bacterium]
MLTEGVFTSAPALATAIRQREVSSSEVVEEYLAQIWRHDPRLNAIVTLDEEGARAGAKEADAALDRGELWGVLHGVPITLEDAHPTSGVRSTWGGLPRLAEHVPKQDGTVAARLKAAGAVLLGKTNGPEIWPDSVFASTNNPWDTARTPGGSSAGPGAAVAAGLTPLDVGLDTLGSIQNPAHYCGVYGMRPTEHRVPMTGVFFLDPVRKFRVMSVAGPMARSIEDLRLALRLLAGPDGYDSEVPPVPWRDPALPEARDLRIAWSSEFPGSNTQDEIRVAVEETARELARRGVTVGEGLPGVDLKRQRELAEEIFGLLAGTFSEEPTAFSEKTDANPKGGRHDPLEDYLTVLHDRDEMMQAWEAFFADWDALILPAGTHTAERHGEKPADPAEEYPYALSQISGCPMVVVPAGVDGRGLPIGLQVLGRRWDDERLLAIAALLANLTGGFRRPPGY